MIEALDSLFPFRCLLTISDFYSSHGICLLRVHSKKIVQTNLSSDELDLLWSQLELLAQALDLNSPLHLSRTQKLLPSDTSPQRFRLEQTRL